MRINEVETTAKTVRVDNSTDESRKYAIAASVQVTQSGVVNIFDATVRGIEEDVLIAHFAETPGSLNANFYGKDRLAAMQAIEQFIYEVNDTYPSSTSEI